MNSKHFAMLLALVLGLPSAYAQDGESVRVSGFGTGALTWTNTNDAQFSRPNQASGAGTSPRTGVDSNLGLQIDARINDWLSLTGQGLVRKDGEDNYGTDATLAFARFTPSDALSVRVGRVPLTVFMVSDYRNVGYANTMVRPSQEVYSRAQMDYLDGADLRWNQKVGSSRLTTQVAYGNSTTTLPGGEGKLKLTNGRVVNFILEKGPFTVRLGRYDGTMSLDVGSFHIPKSKVSFTAAGFALDWKNVIVQSEYGQDRSAFYASKAWYVMGGYRFGKLLPYYSHGKLTGDFAQSTDSIGLRWDAFRLADIKFQIDRVDAEGAGLFTHARPGFHDPVTVGTIAVDFAF